MTLARRIIPCLDVDAGRVVKGVEFAGLRDMGDPEELAARYNSEGADELILLDITASRDGRATFLETVRRVAQQLNIPFTAGGGIRRLEDGNAVLRAGADKITVNTAAVARPELISELAAQFGAQAVVLSMDVKKTHTGWEVFVRGGAESSGRDAAAWAKTFGDFLAVFGEGHADAALAASIFHTAEHSIGALKQYLADRGVPVRLSR
jgi:cyclase